MPKVADPRTESGFERLAWLNRLKTSARNVILPLSPRRRIASVLLKDTSTLYIPGPRKALRPVFPMRSAGGKANDSGLSRRRPPDAASFISGGDTRSARLLTKAALDGTN